MFGDENASASTEGAARLIAPRFSADSRLFTPENSHSSHTVATAILIAGGRGAGNFMTRLTAICAAIFMITSMSLAYLSSAGDRELRKYENSQGK